MPILYLFHDRIVDIWNSLKIIDETVRSDEHAEYLLFATGNKTGARNRGNALHFVAVNLRPRNFMIGRFEWSTTIPRPKYSGRLIGRTTDQILAGGVPFNIFDRRKMPWRQHHGVISFGFLFKKNFIIGQNKGRQ